MKKLLFLCGPNGIGKTTVCQNIVQQLPASAYVDSDACRVMNPFVLNDDTIPTVAGNISSLLRNYLNCPAVETVLFSYGFHGRRREVFDLVMQNLSDLSFEFLPFLLRCSEEENLRRLQTDHRDPGRIARSLCESRNACADLPYPVLDVTNLTVEESAFAILHAARIH